MPLDGKGGYHMNPQVARMHSKSGVPPHHKTEADPSEQSEMGGHVEVHKKEDGFKTVHHNADGSSHEQHHPTLHHALHAVAEHHGGSDQDVHEHPQEHGEPDADDYGIGEETSGADAY